MPAGTPIHTIDGFKDISEIDVGDKVLTHKGRFKSVLRIMKKNYNGKIYSIKLSGVGRSKKTTQLTGDHPVMIFDKHGNYSWTKTENIIVKRHRSGLGLDNHFSYVAFPQMQDVHENIKIKLEEYQPDEIKIDNLFFSKGQKKWEKIPLFIELDEEFAYFLGLFAAEGSFSKKDGRLTGGMRFSLNYFELDLAKRAANFLNKFGINLSCYEDKENSKMDCCFCCLPLCYVVSDLIGMGSKNKKIPHQIFDSPRKVQKAFLDGLLDGDGKKINKKNKQKTLRTSSSHLAYQVRIIISNLGFWSNVYSNKTLDGRTCYTVPITENVKYRRNFIKNNYIIKPISSISVEEKNIEVFNFEVEEDNSYVSDFIVHNCELYINPLQPTLNIGQKASEITEHMSPEERKDFKKSFHLLAIAYSQKGYSNLVNLSSAAWTRGFYYRPRINYELLQDHKEGLIFTSCCYNSEIGQAFDRGGEEEGFRMVERYIEFFGKDNFYLEIMLLDFNKQKPYNKFIIKAHEKYNLPIILSNDCHYCLQEDSKMQRLMLMVQTKKTLKEIEEKKAENETADLFELQDQNLWMKSEEELNAKWLSDYSEDIPYEIFEQAKINTTKIAQRSKGVELDRSIKLPYIPESEEKLLEAIQIGFKIRRLPKNKKYLDRIKEEYQLICQKGFASYFLIQKMMTDEARRICPKLLGYGDGSEAVGPGRGSVVGSLVCYCLGITDVNPIEHDLLFSRFLSPSRGGKQMKLRFSIDPVIIDEDDCPFDVPKTED